MPSGIVVQFKDWIDWSDNHNQEMVGYVTVGGGKTKFTEFKDPAIICHFTFGDTRWAIIPTILDSMIQTIFQDSTRFIQLKNMNYFFMLDMMRARGYAHYRAETRKGRGSDIRFKSQELMHY